jgi:predicted transcriptional regulator
LESLSSRIKRDKGTVFRSLQKLVRLDLCTKESRTLKGGGYYHVYNAAEVNRIEKNTKQKIREIQKSLNIIMKKFRSNIEEMIQA